MRQQEDSSQEGSPIVGFANAIALAILIWILILALLFFVFPGELHESAGVNETCLFIGQLGYFMPLCYI